MSSLKKNLSYNIAYQLLVIILPLITAPYVSRVLGVVGIGTYSYMYSIAFYFALFGILGIVNHGNRSVALSKNNQQRLNIVFSNIYCIQLITTGTALVLYFIFIACFINDNKTIAYIDSLFILAYLLDLNWLFFGLEKFKITVIRNVFFKIGTIACIFLFVKDADDLWLYTLILALGTAISQAYLWLYVKKFVSFVKPSISEIKLHIKPICALFIPVIAYSIYKVMDKIMLGTIANVSQVGLYENSEKIIGIPISIITAFGTVMMPRISALMADKNSKQIDEYTKISFKYFSIIAYGMTFGLIGVSNILPEVYFGIDFIECTPLIVGLSFTLIFITWANIIRTQYLIPTQNDKPYIISTLIGAIVNLIVNILLIAKYQAMGALVGTILAEFLVFFVQMLYVKKEFPVILYIKSSFLYIPMGIVMGSVVYCIGQFLGTSIATLLIQIFSGIAIYGVMVLLGLFFTKDNLLFKVINKIKKVG